MATKGVGQAPVSSTIVLRPASGNLHLKIRHRATRSSSAETVVDGQYDSGEGVPTRDVARRHRMFPRGAGWSSRPGTLEAGTEWDGFSEAENACARFGYVCPSGEQTTITVTTAWGACNKLLSFNDDLFCIFQNRIAYFDNGSGAIVDLYTLSGDTFHDAEVWQGSLRVANQCTHNGVGAGNHHSFVTVTPSGATYTISHPDETYVGGVPPMLNVLATVFWEYQGVADYRLVGKVGPGFDSNEIQWMITPSGDPYDPDNWGPVVSVGESTEPIQELVASHDTVWALKNDGVYAVRDATASAGGENLTPYWRQEIVPGGVNGFYWRDKLIVYRGNRLESIDVNSWQVQDKPRPISVETGRPNNTNLNASYYTALGSDQGWLIAGMKNVSDNAYVLYGTERPRESPTAGVTEYDWFSEVGPFAGAQIGALYTFTPDDGTPDGGRPTLWIAYEQSGTKLTKVDMFRGGSPLADTEHRYNTTASITFTDEHWAARSATKGALRGELAVRNCGSGRKVDFYAVAGAGASFPGSPNASVTTNVETSTFLLTSVRGSVIRTKAVLTSTATTPVVIDEMGLKANLGWPLRRRGTWLVELSDATEGNLPAFETPSTTEAALVALCESVEAFSALDDEGNTMTIVLDNALPWRKEDASTNDLGTRQKVRLLEVAWTRIS